MMSGIFMVTAGGDRGKSLVTFRSGEALREPGLQFVDTSRLAVHMNVLRDVHIAFWRGAIFEASSIT